MWTIVVLAICAVVSASEFTIEDNGWIPVSGDVVYQQTRRGFLQPPRYTRAQDVQTLSFLPKENTNEKFTEKNTRPHFQKQISQEFAVLNDNVEKEDKSSSDAQNKFYMKKIFPAEISTTDNIITRKSKKLLFDEGFPASDEGINVIEDKPAEDWSHTYEVTENIHVEDDIDQEETVQKSINLQNDLIKYLLKYNIKENDNLQNYASSRRRRPNVANTPRNFEYKPLHFKVPFRYNNLNHLPVDPLLAVYLSNYGHYLQGQYGIQNHYNNLYGYLASNNIHNNRPFGHYKLFSDTDSSQ